ncbi:MAG: hypothetical protein PHQ52_05270 [Candidatus Omnitrophica bacterium]|nr:hypothetical protein [Candidatus Omnitrophota bacterium]
MAGILAALITSGICFLIHLIVFSTGIIKIDPSWCIMKLKRHGQFLLVTWILMLPVFVLLFFKLFDISIVCTMNYCTIFLGFCGIVFIGLLFFIYLTFYYVVDRSVSSRLMIEIERSSEKRLTFDQIIKVYHPDTKYENELLGMAQGGFIKKQGDYYINTPKGTFVACITGWYKRTFRLGAGG